MDVLTIASLAVKSVNIYFNKRQFKELEAIRISHEKLIKFEIDKYAQEKQQLLNQANTYFADALTSSSSVVRNESFALAKSLYTQLTCLPVIENLANDCQVDNSNLICEGYWGRFNYFGVMKDYRNSTIQVYKSAVTFPSIAVTMFDSSFFPRLDASELIDLCDNLNKAKRGEDLIGIYKGIPSNMAKSLLESQLQKFEKHFSSILNNLQNEQV